MIPLVIRTNSTQEAHIASVLRRVWLGQRVNPSAFGFKAILSFTADRTMSVPGAETPYSGIFEDMGFDHAVWFGQRCGLNSVSSAASRGLVHRSFAQPE